MRPLRNARGHRPLHPARRRRGDLGAPLHLPRLPLRRGRRAGRASCGRTISGGRLPLRPGAHRLVRVLRPAAEPAARERRVGHARQLPRRADRLPAARRAARLDRRHRRSSRPPPASSTTAPASSTPGWPTWPPSSRRRTASCPLVVPNVLDGHLCPAAALGRCRGDRALGALPALRRRGLLRRPVREHARLGGPPRRPSPGESRLWDTGFQFGDWLDPAAPPDRPAAGAHRPAPGRHRLLRPLGRAARAGGERARTGRRRGALPAAWPPRCAPRSPPSTSRPPGA